MQGQKKSHFIRCQRYFTECSHKQCHDFIGFVLQDFGSGGVTGVASMTSFQKFPPCLIGPMSASAETDLLAKAEPISNSASVNASGIT